MLLEQVLYQAQVTATGGREGRAVSSDGVLDVSLSTPRVLGGAGRRGTNPEQLFAAGYAASFLSAIQYVAARDHLAIPPEITVEGTVGVGAIPQGFGLEVELRIALPGLSPARPRPWSTRPIGSVPIPMPRGTTSRCGWCSHPPTSDGGAPRRTRCAPRMPCWKASRGACAFVIAR